jgi:hypothetical protein
MTAFEQGRHEQGRQLTTKRIVSPFDLSASFGPGVELSRVVLELTRGASTPAPQIWPQWRKVKGENYAAQDAQTIRDAFGRAKPNSEYARLYAAAVLKQADPALVDPGVTAQLECLLDDVVVRKQEMVGAIDAVCSVAERIIGKLKEGAADGGPSLLGATVGNGPVTFPPTPAMKRFADSLARQKGIKPPPGYKASISICSKFLDEHAPKKTEGETPGKLDPKPVSPAQMLYAKKIAQGKGVVIPDEAILGQGARRVIGVGRVKTPTLAIVCKRGLEIRNFVPLAYFEIAAAAKVAGGQFQMRHAPQDRIVRREIAQEVVRLGISTVLLLCASRISGNGRPTCTICRRCSLQCRRANHRQAQGRRRRRRAFLAWRRGRQRPRNVSADACDEAHCRQPCPAEGHQASARLQDVDIDLQQISRRTRAQENQG